MTTRERIEAIYAAGVAAVDPRECVRRAVAELVGSGQLSGEAPNIHVIAIGKAAALMTAGAAEALGHGIAGGVVVTKAPASERLPGLTYLEGAHPVPDEQSLEAGRAVLAYADAVPEGDLVLCLISGGGSALVESLHPGFELADLQAVTRELLSVGAPIEELNAVRSRLSKLKGGGLLRALEGRAVVNLIVSDVLGDNLPAIASGPTVEPKASRTAEEIAERYALDITFPDAGPSSFGGPAATRVIANLPAALDAAAREAERLGMRPVVLSDRFEGEARELGRTLAAIFKGRGHPLSPLQAGACVLAGGETTVIVRGDGVGGRNTEAALAAAIELRESSGVTVGFLATDGDDGVTGAAGAIVDGATISTEAAGRARRALERNDSFGFLAETGAVWAPGATGTNVNDLVIAIIE